MCTGDACRCRRVDANDDLASIGGSSILAQATSEAYHLVPRSGSTAPETVVPIDRATRNALAISKCRQSRVLVGPACVGVRSCYIGSNSKISTAHVPSLLDRKGRPSVSAFAAARAKARVFHGRDGRAGKRSHVTADDRDSRSKRSPNQEVGALPSSSHGVAHVAVHRVDDLHHLVTDVGGRGRTLAGHPQSMTVMPCCPPYPAAVGFAPLSATIEVLEIVLLVLSGLVLMYDVAVQRGLEQNAMGSMTTSYPSACVFQTLLAAMLLTTCLRV